MPGEFYIEARGSKEKPGEIKVDLTPVVQRLEAIQGQLAGEPSYEGSVSESWQSGTATSGEAGADLVSLGEAGKKKKLHSLLVDIGSLTPGAIITIKLFLSVNGVERKVYPPPGTTWVVGTDPDGVWVVNGTVAIHDVLRVEVESDNPSDNGLPIAYTAVLEAME